MRTIDARLAVIAVVLAACNDGSGLATPVPHLEVVTPPAPRGLPEARLLDSVTVRVVDDDGDPLPDVLVQWSPRGAGFTAPVQSMTDANGLAQTSWTLGQEGPQQLEARVGDTTVQVFQTDAAYFRPSALSAGEGIGCGVEGGDLFCWGKGFWKRPRGYSYVPSEMVPNTMVVLSPPAPLTSSGDYIDVVSGGSNAVCGLRTSGAVTCWQSPSVDAPVEMNTPPLRVLAGDVASARFCGLGRADSVAWCWGGALAPAIVDTVHFTALAMGNSDRRVCALKVDSTAACWGNNYLGTGTITGSPTPLAVAGGHHFAAITLGRRTACGRKQNGDLWCLGNNEDGLLGTGDALVPTLLAQGVSSAAAFGRMILLVQGGRAVRRGPAQPITTGTPGTLDGLLLGAVDRGNVGCIQLNDAQVRCWEDMFQNFSGFLFENYVPIQPAAREP